MSSANNATNNADTISFLLREWIEGESARRLSASSQTAEGKRTLLRRTTVAYGIAELLIRAGSRPRRAAFTETPTMSSDERCDIDNFVVRTSVAAAAAGREPERARWDRIRGVDMLSPRLSMNIVEPYLLLGSFDDGNDNDDSHEGIMGSYLEVQFPDDDDVVVAVGQGEENDRCHSFGVLVLELFSDIFPPLPAEGFNRIRLSDNEVVLDGAEGPARKKTLSIQSGTYVHLIERGFPSSISLLVQNILECGEENRPDSAYDSMEAVIEDLRLLVFDPNRFLFHNEPVYDNGCMQLSVDDHKLYGRDDEIFLITDAFCRVSGGHSEAFFVGGFSGSGKSMLVDSLIPRVNVAGGCVLTHKFNQMSKHGSMLDVLAVFNDLCLLIREKHSQQELAVIVEDLVEVFGSDLSVLARLLPNIRALSPQLRQSADMEVKEYQCNMQNIYFTLQHFIRVVSSGTHPVVLFLDDLQWCDKSAFTVVESLLCDSIGSSCVFFVGSYRSNEVGEDHKIFHLERRLRSCGVPTTILSLEGLNPNNLNTMVSDALCMFPRVSEPLSDIVYQKTKGNPFFVLAFLKSLVDERLLEYSIRQRRWVWDEDKISSLDVTGNVLYLLSSKMNGLSTNIQTALKVAACFGIMIKESIVTTLATDSKHSDIRDEFEKAVKAGFMLRVGTSAFKFVHDKIREAAYSLIPESDKNQYHYGIGMSLYSTTKGKDVDDIIFYIVDQIKHGIVNLEGETPEFRIDIAKLYAAAVLKAVASWDHVAANSYSKFALSLLPTNCWESHYDLNLWFSMQTSKSCYALGDVGKAQIILQEVIERCHSLKDKLPAYFLLALIELARENSTKSYLICHEVLIQLGEDIPQAFYIKQMPNMVKTTSAMVERIVSDSDLLDLMDMNEEKTQIMDFYGVMSASAHFSKPEMRLFLVCRKVQLTMNTGSMCTESIIGFIEYAAVLCGGDKNIEGALRLGKAAMSCFKKRYHSSIIMSRLTVFYYSFLAFYIEPLQSSADMFRLGFDVGMSAGDTVAAFFNAAYHIKTALAAGESLPILLDKVDYYLGLAETYQIKIANILFSIFRDTISVLIGKAGSTIPTHNSDAPAGVPNQILETMHIHCAIRAFWQGHSMRCQFLVEKFLKINTCAGKMKDIDKMLILSIHGLNSFRVLRTRNINSHKIKSVPKKAINVFTTATSHSGWNFRNKVHLLEAEQFSFENNREEAKASYDAAIRSARSSRFIHEQGLACELAGYHYKRNGDLSSARSLFDQAKKCYTDWGSQMKVDSITHALESFQDTIPARELC